MSRCGCAKCCYPACPPEPAEPPCDEVSHEVDNNIISIKVGKDSGRGEQNECPGCTPIVVPKCINAYGKKCREGCTKVNVISNENPPPKLPEEDMFFLRTVRQITPNDDLKSTLEIEFKAPRNYMPLPEPGPPPPIIVPKRSVKGKKGKKKKGGKGKGKKKGKIGKEKK